MGGETKWTLPIVDLRKKILRTTARRLNREDLTAHEASDDKYWNKTFITIS